MISVSKIYRLWVVLGAVWVSGCVSLNSVSLTGLESQRGRKVSTEVSKFIFLGFNFDNDEVDRVADQLARKCPGGKVSGVLTKYESVSYIFAHMRKIKASGICLK